jgi:trehalose-phosphatase
MTTRKERLSVSTANALENFGILEEEFRKHQVVVFLDYDGTLTPIVNDPSSATLSSKMKGVLKDLHRLFITGVISGRSLPKIQSFVSIPELYYAGSHGFDIAGPNGTFIQNRIAADFLHELEDLRDLIKQTIQHIPGSEVEDNIFSISLHYRYFLFQALLISRLNVAS